MANVPVVTFSNVIPLPGDLEVTRYSWSQRSFTNQLIYVYKFGETHHDYSDFNPQTLSIGERGFFVWNMYDSITYPNDYQPDFISDEVWRSRGDFTFALGPSAFFTSNSMMPRLLIPTAKVVDNGVKGVTSMEAVDPTTGDDTFNWSVTKTTEYETPTVADYGKIVRSGGETGSMFLATVAKMNTTPTIDVEEYGYNYTSIKLLEPDAAPTGDWLPTTIVGHGAMCFVFFVKPIKPNRVNPETTKGIDWAIDIWISDELNMRVTNGDMLSVYVGEAENNMLTKVPLHEARAKEVPPQFRHFESYGTPYVICVYPVWNGVVVSQGMYSELNGKVQMYGTYCPKIKEASIFGDDYYDGFSTLDPDIVEISCGTAGTSKDVLVDFGNGTDGIEIDLINCNVSASYLPMFFWHKASFDEWFIASRDIPGQVSYDHKIYPIWTKNRTSTNFYSPSGGDTPEAQDKDKNIDPSSEYLLVRNRMEMTKPNRYAAQYFGYYHRIKESLAYTVDNDNGNFNLTWTGGAPADPNCTGNWYDYVTNLNVTMGLDGTSGNITVDKYGLAGQDANVNQDIGALCIQMTSGGDGTHIGAGDLSYVFKGLAVGTSFSDSSDSDTWTIPLVGLEKKLGDIVLVNVPFFDGYDLDEVVDFLTRYGGIIPDTTNAPNIADVQLRASSDVNNPTIDFKTGTPVTDALNTIMEYGLHTYVIRDGKIYFYEIDDATSLPTILGTDWIPYYPDTRIMTKEMTPDFDDLRNEIVIFSMQFVSAQYGTDIVDLPTIPKISRESNTTTPEFPWSKTIVKPIPGVNTDAQIEDARAKIKAVVSKYDWVGRVTIPGNSAIRPYDRWGGMIITNVTQDIDFAGKTWTTSLEMSSGG